MQIKGVKDSSLTRIREFDLPCVNEKGEEVTFKVRLASIPLGFERILNKDLPLPTPPMKEAVLPDGTKRLDHRGNPKFEPDETDTDYKEERDYVTGLRAVAVIRESLRLDKTVKFDSNRADFEEPIKYYETLFEEFVAAGFSTGIMLQLVGAINELSGIKKSDIERAKRPFSVSRA